MKRQLSDSGAPRSFRTKQSLAISVITAMGVGLSMMAAPTPVQAQNQAQPRYQMEATEDGFVRMDRETGHISYCKEKAGGLVCESAADDRRAYEKEISSLQRENKRLRRQAQSDEAGFPTDEELDEAFGFFENFMHRFSRAVKIFSGEMGEEEPKS